MKRVLNVSVLLLCTTVLFSCGKSAHDIINSYVNQLSATVNGSAFTSANTNAQKNLTSGGTQLTIDGTSGTKQRITIAINNYTAATGTYTVGAAGSPVIAAYNSGVTGASDVVGSTGSVAVTSIDKTSYPGGAIVTGTFSFTAGATTITSGAFSVFVTN